MSDEEKNTYVSVKSQTESEPVNPPKNSQTRFMVPNGGKLSLEMVNAKLDAMRNAIPTITAIEPHEEVTKSTAWLRVHCEGQNDRSAAHYNAFMKKRDPSFEGDEYNNFLLLAEGSSGFDCVLRYTSY